MDLGIPPLKIKNLLESNPLKFQISFICRLAAPRPATRPNTRSDVAPPLLRRKFATPGDKSSLGRRAFQEPPASLHSAKGGAVETGCSGLHSIIGCFTI